MQLVFQKEPTASPALPDSQRMPSPPRLLFFFFFYFTISFPIKYNMEMESSAFFFFFQSLHGYLKITKLVLTCWDKASRTFTLTG